MHHNSRFRPSYGYGASGIDASKFTLDTVGTTSTSTTSTDTATAAAPTTKKGFRMTEAQGSQLISTSGDVAAAIIGATRDIKIARITKKDPRAQQGGSGGGGYVADAGAGLPWGTIGLAAGGLLIVGTVIYFATKK